MTFMPACRVGPLHIDLHEPPVDPRVRGDDGIMNFKDVDGLYDSGRMGSLGWRGG